MTTKHPGSAALAVVPAANRADLFARCRAFTITGELKAAGLYPYHRPAQGGPDAISEVQGRPVLMFGSNNYLGLATHPRLVAAATAALAQCGVGTTGSRLLNGTLDLHQRLEARLAAFHRREAAAVFSVGYLANLGAISALCGPGDLVVLDRLAHASLVDACKLAGVRVKRFRHNDPAHLARLLASEPDRPALVAVDGVYSMDGDLAPLPELLAACRRHGARLLVDDAHGVGVFGPTGRGVAEHFGLEAEIDVLVGTLSKATGTLGGYVVADAPVVEYLRHLARPMIFTASGPAAVQAATLAALDLIEEEPERRLRLWENTRRLQSGLAEEGFDIGVTCSPIVPVQVGQQERLFTMWRRLEADGVYASLVLPPAVPPGRCILRLTVMATHTREQVDRAVLAIAAAGREAGVLPAR
ncbi:MAG: 8-amino-7-oxononanoate synthase [Anaeromyxobacter sp.]|nr:8-amino-7-oxononanoate synthase [Anaeromyxobacter sp.]MBL0278301.1 8-amino-7-oxononanoate synthase [Anaeromyxobacter sp.]